MSQIDDLYEHLYTQGSIEPKEAWKKLGIYRLSARINDLRKEGYDIKTIMIDGDGKKFAKYVLEK